MKDLGKLAGFVIALVFLGVVFIPGLGDVTGRYINPEPSQSVNPESDFSLLIVTITVIVIAIVFIYILAAYEGRRY
jgi:hypothetical protein